ncbi:EF-P lysine aminoacylase GenX [Dyella tabacisoli]|uniref:EF-P lysine aminoacylase GenX n=2 Tax=Dyella tabacisoli TaxID=2282381 RepID=A0A369URR2_9GAMM|nr:EF-P lysine aminoacylase GenX [Dyella tabacisoli]
MTLLPLPRLRRGRGLGEGAGMTEYAKELRRNQTDAEAKLWSYLRADQLGHKFRRQYRVEGYIADFCCVAQRLIVELDGSQHVEQHHYNQQRTDRLQAAGLRVLRFWNNDVLLRTDDVLEAIVRELGEELPPHPSPLPRRSRGRGRQASALASLDAIVMQHPVSLPRQLQLRARLYALIRAFFAERNVLEVETPILSASGNTDPNIESFSTVFSGHVDAGARERWLRTSPEYPLKRLLAAGIGDCYELGRVFRNGEAGGRHNPEFSMLEWYRVGWDHRQLMEETIALVEAALAMMGRRAEVVIESYRQLFLDELGLDPMHASLDELRAPLAEYAIDASDLGRDDWLDLLITHKLQPAFPRDRITLIHDYPASQCALARIRAGEPPMAERFELYLGPYELANGYHELNDAAEQRRRFERDNTLRRARGLREIPMDEPLLSVLDAMPDCAGVALGVERLLMCLAGTDAIADVLAFPFVTA